MFMQHRTNGTGALIRDYMTSHDIIFNLWMTTDISASTPILSSHQTVYKATFLLKNPHGFAYWLKEFYKVL